MIWVEITAVTVQKKKSIVIVYSSVKCCISDTKQGANIKGKVAGDLWCSARVLMLLEVLLVHV